MNFKSNRCRSLSKLLSLSDKGFDARGKGCEMVDVVVTHEEGVVLKEGDASNSLLLF